MALRLKPLDISQIQTVSIRRRQFRLTVDHLGKMPKPSEPLHDFYRSLPKVGEAAGMLEAAELMAQTALINKPMVWILDGSMLEAGLSPLMVYLMQRGLVSALVMNGEAALRDYELAFHGVTCEDTTQGLNDGLLGMARETGESINAIINEGVKRGFSIGECVGRGILERQPKNFTNSILATGAARLTPTSVHVTLGADSFHRYPGAEGAMLGKGSIKDIQILSSFLTTLPMGSLIIATHKEASLTQVFLNAYALARNLHDGLRGLHLIRVGEPEPALHQIPALDQVLRVPGPLEIMMPLLLGALFSLVE